MKYRLQTSAGKLKILRSSAGTILFTLFMALACIGMGAGFAFFLKVEGSAQIIFRIFGGFFILAGSFVLLNFPKLLREIKREGGPLVLEIVSSGIRICPEVGAKTFSYSMDELAKIILSQVAKQNTLEGTVHFKNALLIVFKDRTNPGVFELAKEHKAHLKSSEIYMMVGFPRELSTFEMKAKIEQVTGSAIVVETLEEIEL